MFLRHAVVISVRSRLAVRPRSILMLAGLLAWAWSPGGVLALEPYVEFEEMVHTADAIVVAVVGNLQAHVTPLGLVETDATFGAVQVLHRRAHVSADIANGFMLSFAGGEAGDLTVEVCGAPDLEIGQKYIIFFLSDGHHYFNPVIAGNQGLFKIIVDPLTGQEYPVSASDSGIGVIRQGHIEWTETITAIPNGVPSYAPEPVGMMPPPQGTAGGPAQATSQEPVRPAHVLNVSEFITQINQTLTQPPPPPERRVLRGLPNSPPAEPSVKPMNAKPRDLGSIDGFPPRAGKTPTTPPPAPPDEGGPPATIAIPPDEPKSDSKPPKINPLQALCYCGYQNLHIVLEQVPEDWWIFPLNDAAMWQWNQYMDVFQYEDDDGTYGNNSDNDIAGFISDADLYDEYGYHYGTSIAMTISFSFGGCGRIWETDILFNPNVTWYDSLDDAFGKQGALYQVTINHEIGHSWGMMRKNCGKETYLYSAPSVMHAAYTSIVEDGWGMHAADAQGIRQDYSDQTGIIQRLDVGVESYTPVAGKLTSSTTDKTDYAVGDSITVSNVSVENMSSSNTPDVRVRMWLSKNKNITSNDYFVDEWIWNTFNKESWWKGNLKAKIPNVPAGTYYVGLIATVYGHSLDDLTFNNFTYVPKAITVFCPDVEVPDSRQASDGAFTDYVRVTWDPEPTAKQYRVYRNSADDVDTADAISPWQNGTAYNDTTAQPGTTYHYYINSRNECGIETGLASAGTGWRAHDCNHNNLPDQTEPDSDHDGVINGCDQCPNTIPLLAGQVDSVGCPPGIVWADSDHDGDVDLSDFAAFQRCAYGPAVRPPSTCSDHDRDLDNDVDQADFGLFQLCFSGIDQPASRAACGQ